MDKDIQHGTRTREDILCQRRGKFLETLQGWADRRGRVFQKDFGKTRSSFCPSLLCATTVLPNEDTVFICIFRPLTVICFPPLSSLIPALLVLKETHFPTLHPSLLWSLNCVLSKPRQLLPPELGGIYAHESGKLPWPCTRYLLGQTSQKNSESHCFCLWVK